MASAVDQYMLEQKLGRESALKLNTSLKNALNDTVQFRTFNALRNTGAKSKTRDGRLDRITITMPDYVFKLHYGFEGTKKNGVHQRLQATNIINKAIQESGILETLADDLSEIRMEQVLLAINIGGSNGNG